MAAERRHSEASFSLVWFLLVSFSWSVAVNLSFSAVIIQLQPCSAGFAFTGRSSSFRTPRSTLTSVVVSRRNNNALSSSLVLLSPSSSNNNYNIDSNDPKNDDRRRATLQKTTTAARMMKSSSMSSSSSPRIAIIGAGPSGLVASRVFRRNGINPVVFEQAAGIGGVWNYQKQSAPAAAVVAETNGGGNENDDDDNDGNGKDQQQQHHPMYAGLRTNLPMEIMAFREYQWHRTLESDRSYVTHRQVLQYLRDYAAKFDLMQSIRTGCTVNRLTVLSSTSTSSSSSSSVVDNDNDQWSCLPAVFSTENGKNKKQEEKLPKIRIDWTQRYDNVDDCNKDDAQQQVSASKQQQQQQQQQEQYSDVFDGVCVCNGHYSLPVIPDLPGLYEHYKGTVQHSISYNVPETYAGKSVLCVGGHASGSDLARELSMHCSQVFLSDTGFPVPDKTAETATPRRSPRNDNVTWLPKMVSVSSTGEIQFEYGCSIPAADVDVILFCTGYDYDFPFIKNDDHDDGNDDEDNSNLNLDARNRRVKPLLEQLWHATYPNIAFIGLPWSVLPFPLYELQAEAVQYQWCRNYSLPDANERIQLAEQEAMSGGPIRPNGSKGRIPEDTHYLGSGAQWEYCRRMAKYAALDNKETVLSYLATNKTIYDDAAFHRAGWLTTTDSSTNSKVFPAGPDEYRLICYERDDERQSFRSWKLPQGYAAAAATATASAAEEIATSSVFRDEKKKTPVSK